MSYQAQGTITHLSGTRQVTDTFKVRDFVIRVGEDTKFPQLYRMQVVQDHTAQLDNFKEGDNVAVQFDIRGRETKEGKVFTNLQAWRIEAAGVPAATAPQQGALPSKEFEDEIPF